MNRPLQTTDRELLQQALEALERCIEDSAELLAERRESWRGFRHDRLAQMQLALNASQATIAAIRARLAEPDDTEDAVHGRCAAWLRGFIFKHKRDPYPQEVWDAAIAAQPDDTDARAQRVMEAHDAAASAYARGSAAQERRARAELERVVRECVR